MPTHRAKLTAIISITILLCLIPFVYFTFFRSTSTTATTQPSPISTLQAALKANGEPASFADLQTPHVPDADNAVWYFNQAGQSINEDLSGPRCSSLEYGQELPYPPEWHRLAEQMMQANPRALAFARQARSHNKIDWNIRFDQPIEKAINDSLPSLNNRRTLANVIADAALYHHFHRDDVSALECIQDDLHLSDTLAQCPTLISYLVAIGIQALADDSIQILATGLTIEHAAHPANPATTRPAQRQIVTRIIAKLLDDQHARDQFRQTLRCERVFFIEQIVQKKHTRGEHHTPADIDLIDRFITAATQPSFTTPNISKLKGTTDYPLDRIMESLRRIILINRTAAVGLAVRLYYNDTGQYPDSLDKLVPDYLPAVPRDPYGKSDAPLNYLLSDNGARPVVWSVGPDQISQTLDASVLPPHPNYSWRGWRNAEPDDQWIDLSAWHK